MVHYVMQYAQVLVAPDRHEYVARVYAATHAPGRWDGWFVFFPLRGGRELATDRETSQNSLAAVSYWASGISTTYLEGALQRARAMLPEARLARRAHYAEQEEELARAEAATYAEAAAIARLEAHEAAHRRRQAEEQLMEERAAAARTAANLHEWAAAAARGEAREADWRRRHPERRHTERRAAAQQRYAFDPIGQSAPRAQLHGPRRQASITRKKRS